MPSRWIVAKMVTYQPSDVSPVANARLAAGGNVAVVSVEKPRRKKFDALVVRSFRDAVKKHIWDECKFCPQGQLDYDQEFAQKILHDMDMGSCAEETKRCFWNEHKPLVLRVLRTMRNGAVQAVKESLRHVHNSKWPGFFYCSRIMFRDLIIHGCQTQHVLMMGKTCRAKKTS